MPCGGLTVDYELLDPVEFARWILKDFRDKSTDGASVLLGVLWGPPILSLLALAFLYLWSIKSTALVWLPLLWIIPMATTDEPLATRLKLVNRSSWGRLVGGLSIITLVLFALRLLLFDAVPGFVPESALHDLLAAALWPEGLPMWTVASASNSVIALALFFGSSHALIRIEDGGDATTMKGTDLAVRTASVCRAGLSIYSALCVLYIVATLVPELDLPPLGTKLFPWM